MSQEDDSVFNLAVDRASLLFQKARQKIKEQAKGIPIGMKPKSTKEQLEWYLKLTQQDKVMLYQKYGHEDFIRMVADMERLKERSDNAFIAKYNIEEG